MVKSKTTGAVLVTSRDTELKAVNLQHRIRNERREIGRRKSFERKIDFRRLTKLIK
jgi:hypothetical protein